MFPSTRGPGTFRATGTRRGGQRAPSGPPSHVRLADLVFRTPRVAGDPVKFGRNILYACAHAKELFAPHPRLLASPPADVDGLNPSRPAPGYVKGVDDDDRRTGRPPPRHPLASSASASGRRSASAVREGVCVDAQVDKLLGRGEGTARERRQKTNGSRLPWGVAFRFNFNLFGARLAVPTSV